VSISNRRAYNENNDELNEAILIMDTAADQCSCGGPAWVVVDVTDEEVI